MSDEETIEKLLDQQERIMEILERLSEDIQILDDRVEILEAIEIDNVKKSRMGEAS